MILRFGVANFLSFRNYQEISFIATPLKDRKDALIRTPAINDLILPCIAVYGANASGKSNLLEAFNYMVRFVRHSQSRGKPDSKIVRPFFQLDDESSISVTRMDCDIVLNSIRYHYGFEFTNAEITREWLYSYPKRKRQVLFLREKDQDFLVGELMPERGLARDCFKFVRSNSLYISASAQNNHKLSREIYDWFDSVIYFGRDRRFSEADALWGDDDTRDFVVKVVQCADPSITGGFLEEEEVPDESRQFLQSFDEFMKSRFPDIALETSRDTRKRLKLQHQGLAVDVPFEPEMESGGTKTLLKILGPLRTVLKGGRLIIFDELEASLHALITIRLIDLFQSSPVNKAGAQLWFVTHDTNLLCHSSLRRDQVWFAEKSKFGETAIYSLSELSVRKTDNLERGYLQGRFGAIPFFGDVESLLFDQTVGQARQQEKDNFDAIIEGK